MDKSISSTRDIARLRGQKAALTKKLEEYHKATDEHQRDIVAKQVVAILDRQSELGFTHDDVSGGKQIPNEILRLTTVGRAIGVDTGGLPYIADKEVTEAMDTTFGLERDLQRAIRANIAIIDANLQIIDGGKERTVASGRIDILAEDQHSEKVVIELKAGQADRDAIVQALCYMGDLGRTTRGILIAGDFTTRAISAARVSPNIRLLRYSFKFNFKTIEDDAPDL